LSPDGSFRRNIFCRITRSGTAAAPPALSVKVRKRKEQPMHKEEGRTVETPVEARQGFLDRPVLAVLVVSVALVLVLYGFIYFGFFGTS
jgi:cobalamin biosynthesis Mg chelatase CobN